MLYCLDACFIGEDVLEKLPAPSMVGATRVGVNIEQVRMRRVVEGVVELSTSPAGFSASELAARVKSINGLSESEHGARRAAYDIKKLRGKAFIIRRGKSRRYEPAVEVFAP